MKCKQITTYSTNGKAYLEVKNLPVTLEADEPKQQEAGILNIYPNVTYQVIDGFGGAMTESAAYLLSKMDEVNRRSALEKYFGNHGNHLKFVRIHIDSCDYSLQEYTAVEDPANDPDFATFSLKRDQLYILPMLKEAMAISKEPLSVLLSPWSPPACWKNPPQKPKNDLSVYGNIFENRDVDYDVPSRCNGGSLRPEYYSAWAKYLVKFVIAYLDEGVPVTMLSIQNESIAATTWDSCVWTAEEQKNFLRDFLYPEIKAANLLGKIGIYIWDHNKERVLEYATTIIDEVTDKMIEGIAFHWYSGDHFEAIEMTSKKYPDKVLLMSECCGLHPPGKSSFYPILENGKTPATVEYDDAVAYAHDIIGNLNAGMQRWIDWNLCVNEEGGPRHVPGGFTAAMIVDEAGDYHTNLTYDFVGHFSKYILPGSVRIGHSRCDDKIEMVTVENPEKEIVAVLLNRTNEDYNYVIRMSGHIVRIAVPARTISTIILT